MFCDTETRHIRGPGCDEMTFMAYATYAIRAKKSRTFSVSQGDRFLHTKRHTVRCTEKKKCHDPSQTQNHTNPLKSCKTRRIALGIQESSKYVINIRSRLITSITNKAGLNSILLCEPSIGV